MSLWRFFGAMLLNTSTFPNFTGLVYLWNVIVLPSLLMTLWSRYIYINKACIISILFPFEKQSIQYISLTFSPLGPDGPEGPMGPVKPYKRKIIINKIDTC